MSEYKPTLTKETINPNVINAQYAVRGAVPARANEIEVELKEGKKYPFDKVIYCNIGNPHRLGQHPLKYWREVCSLLINPDLLSNPKVEELYEKDVIERAKDMFSKIPGGLGAYSHSQGLKFILDDVAEYISKRDGYPCSSSSVFLTQGASPGIQSLLQLIIRSPTDGILIPIPQYPLYTGTLALLGARPIPYPLNELDGWGLSLIQLKNNVIAAKSMGIVVRAIVIINPGNPTGAALSEENILEILSYAKEERMVVLADEVYQTNIYSPSDHPFISFRAVLKKNEEKLKGLELVSFNSISKGYFGECGIRGGYFQLENLSSEASSQLLKLASLSLCPNVLGQVMVDLMVKGPKEGTPSYDSYEKEKKENLASLARRAKKLTEALNSLPCCSCQPVVSSMYAFPTLLLPPKAEEEAKKKGMTVDTFYSFSLLEETGLCVVPGSGFGQAPHTFHIRTTILPLEEDFDIVIKKFSSHHINFIKKYGTDEWIEEQEKKKN